MAMVESILLTAVPIVTFRDKVQLTGASGFFFARDQRLFLVTSRHVFVDEPTAHHPDQIEIKVHDDADNMASSAFYSIPLFNNDEPVWTEGVDDAGPVDVAVLEIDQAALPATAVYHAFTPDHLLPQGLSVDVGSSLLVVGFPMGFHDTLHHMPVARQAIVASSFGLRFQGQGYFLTDSRTHRGSSGSPVVMRSGLAGSYLPWTLLGVHSASLDVGSRNLQLDEALGLNCAWYADILLTLTR